MRRATVRTDHADAVTARRVAAAVRPDNTEEMDTQVDGTSVATTVDRATTGGLHSTLDDYVVNLQVAARLLDPDGPQASRHTETTDAEPASDTEPTGSDAETASDTETTRTDTETQATATDAESTTDTTTDT